MSLKPFYLCDTMYQAFLPLVRLHCYRGVAKREVGEEGLHGNEARQRWIKEVVCEKREKRCLFFPLTLEGGASSVTGHNNMAKQAYS